MNAASGGKTYSEVSGQYVAMSQDAERGPEGPRGSRQPCGRRCSWATTLRGLLLYGYAFATMGTIALYAAIASFVGAGVLLLLSLLGIRHARRTADEPVTRAVPVPA